MDWQPISELDPVAAVKKKRVIALCISGEEQSRVIVDCAKETLATGASTHFCVLDVPAVPPATKEQRIAKLILEAQSKGAPAKWPKEDLEDWTSRLDDALKREK